MAGENLMAIFSALPQLLEDDLHRQWNRTTFLLGALQAKAGISEGKGKNVAFDVEFTGGTAQTVAEGSDVPATEYAQDIDVPAMANWATYRSSFQVTETEIDAAATSGPQGMPLALRDIVGTRILSCGALIASQIENDALIGTGVDANGNPTIVGIYGGAIAASGSYLGLNTATYSEWASNVTSNGGTARQLTPDLIEQVDANIFTASSLPWDLCMTSAGVARKYIQFFTQGSAGNNNMPLVRMMDTMGGGQPRYGLGVVTGSDGQYDGLAIKGRPVLRNRLNPTGKLALLNTSKIMFKYLPRKLTQQDLLYMKMFNLEGSSGGMAPIQATQMPLRVAEIAKTGDSLKITMMIRCQMALTRRNAHGALVDISEV
jgi:hypothetical protein